MPTDTEIERVARQIAARKMGLLKDLNGERLPDDLWRQCIPTAKTIIKAGSDAEANDTADKFMLMAERAFKARDKALAENARLLATLNGIAEYCSGDGRPLGAIERLAAIRNTAERAVATTAQPTPLASTPPT